jgi:cytochrome c553
MKRLVIFASLTLVWVMVLGVYAAQQQAPAPPLWAFPVATGGAQRGAPAPADDGSPKHVPNSNVALTLAQVRDTYNIPDWHPDNHPAAPEIVTHGRRPNVISCGYCHLPNGQGRPENASVAGLPKEYIVQQMADFKSGARKSSESRLGPINLMVNIAKAATDEEVKAAADYFSSFKLKPWIRVVETATVPKTRIAGGMYAALEGNEKEPIGNRVIEVPENLEQTELRDSGSGFIAYVPLGSIKKGEALAAKGQCALCHGADLRGLGPVPGIAGRSPDQMGRQLWDMQHGTRNGVWAELMKPVLKNMSEEDLVSITAYLASRTP